MLAGKRQRLLKIVGANHLENRTENFFLVAFHVGFDMVEQRRPYKEAFLMALQLEAATVDDQFSAFINALPNPALDLRLVRGRYDWNVMFFRNGGKDAPRGFNPGNQE